MSELRRKGHRRQARTRGAGGWPLMPPLSSLDLQEMAEWWTDDPPRADELAIANSSRMYANRRRG